MIDMEKMFGLAEQIKKAYAEDRYTDIDGMVWLGIDAEEKWVREDDTGYLLTNAQMMKKMINELSGDEQFRRDEAVRREALYEYAIKRTVIGLDETTYVGGAWCDRGEVNMSLLTLTSEKVEYKLVRRRKAGPVEEVDI